MDALVSSSTTTTTRTTLKKMSLTQTFLLPKSPLPRFTSTPHRNFSYHSATFSLSICCKLRSPQDKFNRNELQKKIVVSEPAPSPSEEDDVQINGGGTAGVLGLFKRFPRRVLAVLSNLPLAIGEMFIIAGLMALGTLIDQGEAPNFYFQKFPEDNPLFGFVTWRWVLTLGFDHMFSSPVFLAMLVLLAASLMACTYTTQIPLVKVARRWSFLHSADAIRKLEVTETLPRGSVQDLGVILMGAGYEVFLKGPTLYAFKGLAGRLAPIGVHLAMLLIMAGGTLSAAGSFKGSVTVPQGLNFVMGDVLGPSGFLSAPTESFNTEVHVNKFFMDYYESGEVSQFHSDLSLFDLNGKEVMRKTISVNDPLRYGGITIYQTDWSLSALQIMKDDEGPFNLAMAPLKLNRDKKLYGTFLPVGDADSPNIKGISMLARDLQSVILYDQEGKFAGVRRPNSKLPIDINGTKVVILDAIGSTGLDLKTDPGVPIVYAGFGAVMLTTSISFLSHAQRDAPKTVTISKLKQCIKFASAALVWAVQDGTALVVGGKSNRAKSEFPNEINQMLDWVPEIVDTSASKL